MKNTINIISTISILVLFIFLVGCETTPPAIEPGTYTPTEVFDPDKELTAKTFSSIAEFNDFVKRTSTSRDYGVFGVATRELMVEEAVAVAPTKAIAAGEEAPSDYSETNIQVMGVDEADIIKTDGNYIYTVSGKTLFIIKAYPGEDAEIISTLKFDNNPASLFVNDNYLAVFGNYHNLDFFKKIDFIPRQGMTFFNIYDISDRENPELVKEYKFEGNYFQARMIDDYVYFITTARPEYRIDLPTPIIIEDAVVRTIPVRNIHYYPIPYQQAQFATIHAINILEPDKDINSKTVAVEGSQNMYMSANNIYITYTQHINEWDLQKEIIIELIEPMLTDSDKALIEKIKQTDGDVLSQYEKESKIFQIIQSYVDYMDDEEQQEVQDKVEELLEKKLEEYKYMEFTLIHKISVDEDDIRIAADGKIPGHVINQFSMDEYNDVFRIATTINARWSRLNKLRQESTNNIFTLDKDLDMMDGLTGLA